MSMPAVQNSSSSSSKADEGGQKISRMCQARTTVKPVKASVEEGEQSALSEQKASARHRKGRGCGRQCSSRQQLTAGSSVDGEREREMLDAQLNSEGEDGVNDKRQRRGSGNGSGSGSRSRSRSRRWRVNGCRSAACERGWLGWLGWAGLKTAEQAPKIGYQGPTTKHGSGLWTTITITGCCHYEGIPSS